MKETTKRQEIEQACEELKKAMLYDLEVSEKSVKVKQEEIKAHYQKNIALENVRALRV